MSTDALEKAIEKNKKAMEKAASELDFKEAARLRDEMYELQDLLKKRQKEASN
jgi:excinuclease ABC subunit B